MCVFRQASVTAEKSTENCQFQHVATEKPSPCADQTRSTRDILHLIQSRATDDSSRPGPSPATACSDTVSNGPRQFQVRPQLFEAIMMQPMSADRLNTEQNLSSPHTAQSMPGYS